MSRDVPTTDNEPEHVSDRAFRVLEVIRKMGPGAHSLSDIVDCSELSRSSVQRIIRSGMREGIIRQIRHGHYAIAPVDAAKKHPYGRSVSAYAQRELQTLQYKVHQSVGLHAAILVGALFQTCIAWLPGDSKVSVPWAFGTLRPLTEDAPGRAILAHLNMPQAGAPRPSLTRGCTVSDDPLGRNLTIAAPILQDGIPIGAISISGRQQEMRQQDPSLLDTLRGSASRINPLAVPSLLRI